MSPYKAVASDRIVYGNSFDYRYRSEPVSLNDWNKLLLAARHAQTSSHRFRIAAIVTKSGRVLSRNTNKNKSHPFVPPRRFSLHAEVSALMSLDDVKGCTVYVSRLDSTDNLMPARSCLYCIGYMLSRGVDRVVFSVSPNSCDSFHLSSVTSHLLN